CFKPIAQMAMLGIPAFGFVSLSRTTLMLRTLLPALLVMVMSTSLFAQPLSKGDRIVFLGDSITQAGAGPRGYVTQVREALEKQELGIEVLGAGISGNKVPD